MKHLALTLLLTAATACAAPDDLLKAGLLSPEIIQKIKPELELTAEQESKMTAIVSEAREKGSSVESAFKEQQKTLHLQFQLRLSSFAAIPPLRDQFGLLVVVHHLRRLIL